MEIHWRQRIELYVNIEFENRHNAGVSVTVIAKCNTHECTHTRARARRRMLSILPIPNRHIISIFDILYGSRCSGVLQKQFSFFQWIVLKPVGVKFHWGLGGGGEFCHIKRQWLTFRDFQIRIDTIQIECWQ